MSDGQFKFPEWQAPLQELILEPDREKFLEKKQQVERLIFERRQQLLSDGNDPFEYSALNDAMVILRVIKERERTASGDTK